MNDCLFCKIAQKKIPATIVYEDESVLAFKDINPKAPYHFLFIPKTHYTSLLDIQETDVLVMGQIFSAIQKVAHKLSIADFGFKTTIHTGKGGGQEVFHLHVHLLSTKV